MKFTDASNNSKRQATFAFIWMLSALEIIEGNAAETSPDGTIDRWVTGDSEAGRLWNSLERYWGFQR